MTDVSQIHQLRYTSDVRNENLLRAVRGRRMRICLAICHSTVAPIILTPHKGPAIHLKMWQIDSWQNAT